MFDKVKNQDHLLGKTNRIVEGTSINGDITTFADFRLDGKLTGNFTSEGKILETSSEPMHPFIGSSALN